MQLCFFHGLDSSPQGTKARLLKRHYPGCTIPALPPDIHERLAVVEKEIDRPVLAVGSSLGGLTALMFAGRHPERIAAMLLMAPAVGCREESLFTAEQQQLLETIVVPAGIPTIIIAGVKDEFIPLSSIRALVERSPLPRNILLNEVDDDHSLHRSLETMLQAIEQLKAARGETP